MTQDQLLRAEARAQRRLAGDSHLKRRLGWPMALMGGGLFLAGYVGAQAGTTILPFDQHHIVSQIGGLLIGLTGVIWATR
jgi:hypothetical protein